MSDQMFFIPVDLTSGVRNALPIANGGTASTTAQAAAAALGVPFVLAQSAIQQAHTGDTNAATLATVTLPANSLGANGCVRITCVYSYTNSSNTKTTTVKLGGQVVMNFGNTTTASIRLQTEIHNRNATNSQVLNAAGGVNWGQTGGSPTTLSLDTTSNLSLTFNCQLANSGETIALESYLVEVMYHA